ncbi:MULTISPECIES: hypothetical protein [unclassified Microbacterium]|uniref:hypothetical protein n=1 Tax=unclassified Microbacterium TaxID=2609290 RepID=UPI0038702C27
MYSIDGVRLDNPSMGWALEGSSAPLSGHTVERTSVRIPGLPGVLAGIDHPLEGLSAPTISLVVETPREKYDALAALLLRGSKLSLSEAPGREADYECMSVAPNGILPGDKLLNATAVLRIPGVFWRDAAVSTRSAQLSAQTVTFDAWEGSGLIPDAIIRIRGAVANLRVQSDYAYLQYPAINAGSFLRYESATGRAFVTTSDTWTGGTEVAVDADGPGGKFGIFPTRLDVDESRARMTVTTTARSVALIEARGRGAQLV